MQVLPPFATTSSIWQVPLPSFIHQLDKLPFRFCINLDVIANYCNQQNKTWTLIVPNAFQIWLYIPDTENHWYTFTIWNNNNEEIQQFSMITCLFLMLYWDYQSYSNNDIWQFNKSNRYTSQIKLVNENDWNIHNLNPKITHNVLNQIKHFM